MKQQLMPVVACAAILCTGCAVTWEGLDSSEAKKSNVEAVSSPSFDPQKITRLAIIWPRMREYGESGQLQQLIEDEFTPALMVKGYNLVARSDVQAILAEQQFQKSGLTDEDAAKIGRLLNVPAVLVINVSELKSTMDRGQYYGQYYSGDSYKTRCSMAARLLNVERGEILWFGKNSASAKSSSDAPNEAAVKKTAREIAQAFPVRNP